jgi:hypothetical protein
MIVPAIAPSDELAVVLQAGAFGALIGAAVVARRGRRIGSDAALITARWTLTGAGIGVALVLARRLGLV